MAKGANEPRPKEPQPKISHNLEISTYMIYNIPMNVLFNQV